MNEENSIKKICSFYVSDLHLVTMLLPYLDKKIKAKENIITILEKNLESDVKLVLSKLTLNEFEKEKILNINWNHNSNMNKKINSKCTSIIVNGSKEFIENVNKNLNTYFKNTKQKEVSIINCYDITKLDEEIKEILTEHDKILNTSGEKEINEVFEGYEKRKLA